MHTRLFHAIVLVGGSIGAAGCGLVAGDSQGEDGGATTSDATAAWETITGPPDRSDTAPTEDASGDSTIVVTDAGVDTWPSIAPAIDSGQDTADAAVDTWHVNACATCATRNANCGAIGDGCGGILQCGVCPSGQWCNGSNQCAWPPICMPRTCASQGANCGLVGDGCGGILQCGNCLPGETCGAGGRPNVCGPSVSDAGPFDARLETSVDASGDAFVDTGWTVIGK